MKIGLIVNPYAGVGGSAALKGSDGKDIVKLALERGARLKSGIRARTVFEELIKDGYSPEIIAAPGSMGSDILKSIGLEHEVVGHINEETDGGDTTRIARELVECGIELLIFAGGDGTARDVYDAVGERIPVIGIPAGTKMHSAVFANTPEAAAKVIEKFIDGDGYENMLQEVMDIDEEAFRREVLNIKLYGFMTVPFVKRLVQAQKSTRSAGGVADVETICGFEVDSMEDDTLYLIGTGSTLKPIMDMLGLDGSLLGVDAVYNKKQVGKDLSEKEILKLTDEYKKTVIVITVIGGQGYLFGRGNQQFSPEVLMRVGKENIRVLATKDKLSSIDGPLLVDTGDEKVNEYLRGYYRVVTDYGLYTLKQVN